MAKVTLKVNCTSCGGTGLYKGFMEPMETAVPCQSCGATGCQEKVFETFSGRIPKDGIKWVEQSKGPMPLLTSRAGIRRISYEEFKNGKMP